MGDGVRDEKRQRIINEARGRERMGEGERRK